MKTARLFVNGGSQAVRLPAEFRFEGEFVHIRRDPVTGDVILSSKPQVTWADFVALREKLGVEMGNYLKDREMTSETRDPFKDWVE